jgi:hypothetical protein
MVLVDLVVGNGKLQPLTFGDKVHALTLSRVFLLEGLLSMLFAIFIYYRLPDYPKSQRTSSWLTEREQNFVEFRLSENAPKTHDAAFSKEEAVLSLKDIKLWSFMTSQVFGYTSLPVSLLE